MNRRSFLTCCGAIPAALAPLEHGAALDADRWLEIDLYWFDRDHLENSATEFWNRYAPLFRAVGGWRGVILNVGWVMDYVLDWRGDLDRPIPLPRSMKQENWFKVGGQLTGDTAERKRQWKRRFSQPAAALKTYYQSWSYRDLARLVEALRRTGESHGVAGVKVGTFVLGWKTIYGGEASEFSARHPEAYLAGFNEPAFNPEAKLTADSAAYGAFPRGTPAGMPVNHFFGAQWGHLSKAAGLDALVLRDSMLGPIPYRRCGPWGRTLPADPPKWMNLSRATAELVKAIKLKNPDALVIGYSGAASAVGEWRAGGVDLEAIAREGYLDAYIDQTWAGAWNEVGVRENTFWNAPHLGWTYQLGNVLLHAAMFAGTKVRHYPLVETFDAWESWDIIHTAPERLDWGIWAYLHAAVKTPRGLRLPAGSYISWGNQGKRLLSEDDVAWLSKNLNEAVADARQVREVFGPTLVYSRQTMEWISRTAPQRNLKEWIDEQAGAIMKWSVPILSVTRAEYLPAIKTELPILQTPAQMPQEELEYIKKRLAAGQPVAIFASPACGLHTALAGLAGIEPVDATVSGLRKTAALETKDPALAHGIPPRFALYHPFSANRLAEGGQTIHSVDESPALVRKGSALFWDPADIDVEPYPDWFDKPLRERLGSPYPFVLVARALRQMLAGTASPLVGEIDPERPVPVLAWQLRDGGTRILVGNTEEGISDAADQSRRVTITQSGVTLKVELGQAESRLLDVKSTGSPAPRSGAGPKKR